MAISSTVAMVTSRRGKPVNRTNGCAPTSRARNAAMILVAIGFLGTSMHATNVVQSVPLNQTSSEIPNGLRKPTESLTMEEEELPKEEGKEERVVEGLLSQKLIKSCVFFEKESSGKTIRMQTARSKKKSIVSRRNSTPMATTRRRSKKQEAVTPPHLRNSREQKRIVKKTLSIGRANLSQARMAAMLTRSLSSKENTMRPKMISRRHERLCGTPKIHMSKCQRKHLKPNACQSRLYPWRKNWLAPWKKKQLLRNKQMSVRTKSTQPSKDRRNQSRDSQAG